MIMNNSKDEKNLREFIKKENKNPNSVFYTPTDPIALKNIKDAQAKIPEELKGLIEKRGDLQSSINDARQWGDDTTALQLEMREINLKINNF